MIEQDMNSQYQQAIVIRLFNNWLQNQLIVKPWKCFQIMWFVLCFNLTIQVKQGKTKYMTQDDASSTNVRLVKLV